MQINHHYYEYWNKERGGFMKKTMVGAIGAIAVSTLLFGGICQSVKAIELNRVKSVPTTYSINLNESNNLESLFVDPKNVQIVNDVQYPEFELEKSEVVQLVYNQLQSIFQIDVQDAIIQLTYEPVSSMQKRAMWQAKVNINENLLYEISMDAITGENYTTAKRIFHNAHVEKGINKPLLMDHETYETLVKEYTENLGLVHGEIKTVKYVSQGFDENENGLKNTIITFLVETNEGDQVQVSVSTYNNELLSIEYRSWLEQAAILEERLEKEFWDTTPDFVITEHYIEQIEKGNKPLIIEN